MEIKRHTGGTQGRVTYEHPTRQHVAIHVYTPTPGESHIILRRGNTLPFTDRITHDHSTRRHAASCASTRLYCAPTRLSVTDTRYYATESHTPAINATTPARSTSVTHAAPDPLRTPLGSAHQSHTVYGTASRDYVIQLLPTLYLTIPTSVPIYSTVIYIVWPFRLFIWSQI